MATLQIDGKVEETPRSCSFNLSATEFNNHRSQKVATLGGDVDHWIQAGIGHKISRKI